MLGSIVICGAIVMRSKYGVLTYDEGIRGCYGPKWFRLQPLRPKIEGYFSLNINTKKCYFLRTVVCITAVGYYSPP